MESQQKPKKKKKRRYYLYVLVFVIILVIMSVYLVISNEGMDKGFSSITQKLMNGFKLSSQQPELPLQQVQTGNNSIMRVPKWKVTYSTDYDYFVYIPDKQKKDSEICLLSFNATKSSDIFEEKNIYYRNSDLKEKAKVKKVTINNTDYYGYCVYSVNDSYVKFGKYSTVVEWTEENLVVQDSLNQSVAELTLNTPLYYRVIDDNNRSTKEMIASVDVNVYYPKYIQALKGVTFNNILSNNAPTTRDFEYRYRIINGYRNVTDYNVVCDINRSCHDEIAGSHLEPSYEWLLLDNMNLSGQITIGLFTDVRSGEKIDWIPDTWFDLKIDLWGIFEGATKIEYFETGANTYYLSTTTRAGGQTFTVGTTDGSSSSWVLNGIGLNIQRTGTPNTITIGLYSTDGSGLPLALLVQNSTVNANNFQTTFQWENITLPTYTLLNGTKYAIVINKTTTASVEYRDKDSGGYANGAYLDNSAGSWVTGTPDNYFQVYATSDLIYPVFSNNNPPQNNSAYVLNQNYSFYINITNTNGTAGFSFNGVNSTMTNVTTNFTGNVSNLAVGTYSYYYWAFGSGSNHWYNNSQTFYLTIAQANSTTLLYLNHSRNNITIYETQSIYLNATRTGEGNVKLYNNGTLINSGTNIFNNTQFNDSGLYNITATYDATQNYTSSLETFYVNVSQGNGNLLSNITFLPTTATPTTVFNLNFTVSCDSVCANANYTVTKTPVGCTLQDGSESLVIGTMYVQTNAYSLSYSCASTGTFNFTITARSKYTSHQDSQVITINEAGGTTYVCDVRSSATRINSTTVTFVVATLGNTGLPENHALTSDCYDNNGNVLADALFTNLATGQYYSSYYNTGSGFCFIRDSDGSCGFNKAIWNPFTNSSSSSSSSSAVASCRYKTLFGVNSLNNVRLICN